MTGLTIVKVGGGVLEEPQTRDRFVSSFAAVPGLKVLVHGGGRLADLYLKKLGIQPRMVEGRRLTDGPTLEVVTMVYGGLVNKQVVAGLQKAGVNALGLSGADGGIITSHKRPVKQHDYGYVGDIVHVEAQALVQFIALGYVPVICPLTCDNKGQLLNTNADTIAREVAMALSGSFRISLRFCIDYPGVMLDTARPGSVLPLLDRSSYEEYRNSKVIVDGMIPKLDNAFATRAAGIQEVVIAGLDTLSDPDKATRIAL
jgi:acetylglutamate kinase